MRPLPGGAFFCMQGAARRAGKAGVVAFVDAGRAAGAFFCRALGGTSAAGQRGASGGSRYHASFCLPLFPSGTMPAAAGVHNGCRSFCLRRRCGASKATSAAGKKCMVPEGEKTAFLFFRATLGMRQAGCGKLMLRERYRPVRAGALCGSGSAGRQGTGFFCVGSASLFHGHRARRMALPSYVSCRKFFRSGMRRLRGRPASYPSREEPFFLGGGRRSGKGVFPIHEGTGRRDAAGRDAPPRSASAG